MVNGTLKMSCLDKSADIVVGDTIITSGSGGLFPKGLTVGTVASVETESDGMSKYATLQPAVDINSVTRVYIITDYTVSE